MPVQLPESAAMEEAVVLIRRRIEEKRLYEAKFLCRQWRDAADGELVTLAATIAGHLQRVDNCRRQAREAMATGRYAEADRLFAAAEAIAIDVPGLAEEKQALAAAAILLRPPSPKPTPAPSPAFQGRMTEEPTPQPQVTGRGVVPDMVGSPTERRRQFGPVSWRIGGSLVLLGLVAGMLWYFWARESVPPLPVAGRQTLSSPDTPVRGAAVPLPALEPPTPSPALPPQSAASQSTTPVPPAAAVPVPPGPAASDQAAAPASPVGDISPPAAPQPKPGPPDSAPRTLPATPKKTVTEAATPPPGFKLGTLQIESSPKP